MHVNRERVEERDGQERVKGSRYDRPAIMRLRGPSPHHQAGPQHQGCDHEVHQDRRAGHRANLPGGQAKRQSGAVLLRRGSSSSCRSWLILQLPPSVLGQGRGGSGAPRRVRSPWSGRRSSGSCCLAPRMPRGSRPEVRRGGDPLQRRAGRDKSSRPESSLDRSLRQQFTASFCAPTPRTPHDRVLRLTAVDASIVSRSGGRICDSFSDHRFCPHDRQKWRRRAAPTAPAPTFDRGSTPATIVYLPGRVDRRAKAAWRQRLTAEARRRRVSTYPSSLSSLSFFPWESSWLSSVVPSCPCPCFPCHPCPILLAGKRASMFVGRIVDVTVRDSRQFEEKHPWAFPHCQRRRGHDRGRRESFRRLPSVRRPTDPDGRAPRHDHLPPSNATSPPTVPQSVAHRRQRTPTGALQRSHRLRHGEASAGRVMVEPSLPASGSSPFSSRRHATILPRDRSTHVGLFDNQRVGLVTADSWPGSVVSSMPLACRDVTNITRSTADLVSVVSGVS